MDDELAEIRQMHDKFGNKTKALREDVIVKLKETEEELFNQAGYGKIDGPILRKWSDNLWGKEMPDLTKIRVVKKLRDWDGDGTNLAILDAIETRSFRRKKRKNADEKQKEDEEQDGSKKQKRVIEEEEDGGEIEIDDS